MSSNENITPSMPPPAGQSSNFVDPPYVGTKFLVVNCVFLPMAVLSLVVRTWTRVFLVRSFCSDDYLMIAACVLSCVMTATTCDMLNYGLGKHMWDVPANHLSPYFMKLNLISSIIYCAATGITKVSVLIFYMRIFPSKKFHAAVWVLVCIAAGYSFASVMANVFSCTPVAKSWDVSITGGECMNRSVFYFANAGLGIFTDFATVLVPIPWLRRLQMPTRQKIAVGCILAMGCFVGIVSCIRLSTLYTLMNSTDLTWATTDALMWCAIELNLGIVGGCATAMRPFVRRYFPRFLGRSTGRSYPTRNGYPLGSIPRSDHPDFTNRSRNHDFSGTLTTVGGPHNSSEEHILGGGSPKEMDGIVRTVEFETSAGSKV